MDARITANALRRELTKAGLQGRLSAEAFQVLLQHVVEVQGSREVLNNVLNVVNQEMQDAQDVMVSKQQMEAAIRQQAGSSRADEMVAVVNAFDVPKISYDPVSKRLYADTKWQASLLPDARYKLRLYSDRLNLLYQRLRRNKRFQPRAQGGDSQAHLTELMGLKGSLGQRRIVMGAIRSNPDGSYSLEDAASAVPLDLEGAELAAGFVTENCVVMAEGELGHDGRFRVCALGFPSCEPRSALPATAQMLNFFGGPPLSEEGAARAELAELDRPDERLVMLANVWLDLQSTFDSLDTLLAAFEGLEQVPAMFVLMGNFSLRSQSGAGAGAAGGGAAGLAGFEAADYPALRAGFSQLADLIKKYPRIQEGSQFVFVPGPGDPGLGSILPQPPLPSYFTSDLQAALPSAVFTSNPARIRYFNRHITLFRSDLMKAMQRRCLVRPPGLGEDAPPEAAFSHLALTVLQQSLLCPLPLVAQPVHWAFDHALYVYPLPHVLVLADGSSPQASFRHEGCLVFNPGSLQDRQFSALLPFQDELEPSELPGGGGGASQAAAAADDDMADDA